MFSLSDVMSSGARVLRPGVRVRGQAEVRQVFSLWKGILFLP